MQYTGSSYKGDYVNGRIEGRGQYTLPTGTRYDGELLDGLFHGTGALCFPHGGRFEATWKHGVAKDGMYIFADGLVYSENDWTHCDGRHRQYYTERCNGFKPAGLTQLTHSPSARDIPEGCYECHDGFYNPNTREVSTYEHKLLRYAERARMKKMPEYIAKVPIADWSQREDRKKRDRKISNLFILRIVDKYHPTSNNNG
uniref:MORN repeat-containing protein 5 n=1 Tax=Eptatretus burgeri TaxID=7764 RepID=A0A8C4NEY8_EPTBU